MYIILLFGFLLLGCSVQNRHSAKQVNDGNSSNEQPIGKADFLKLFKMDVFLHSLQYSFNDSPEIRKILNEDKSGGNFVEFIDPKDDIAVAKMLTAKIKADSANNVRQAPSDLRGKTVFQSCIEFYNSKQLDSIAKVMYKTKYSKPQSY